MSSADGIERSAVQQLLQRISEFQNKALRRWSQQGFLSSCGCFAEALDTAGEPLVAADQRLRVQARQIYVFAHAAQAGYGRHFLAVAEQAADSLQRRYRHNEGGWVDRLSADGAVVDSSRHSYETAFVVLAFGRLAAASGCQKWRAVCDQSWHFLEQRLADPVAGGFWNGLPKQVAEARQQNPHMHLFEATLSLVESCDDPLWKQRAESLYQLFINHFWDRDGGFLREFFANDWRVDTVMGDRLEPGHHYEWYWLLDWQARLLAQPLPAAAESLYGFALRHGQDASGLVLDGIDPVGHPLQSSKRLWVQTEALKAHLVHFVRSADSMVLRRAMILVERIFVAYLDEARGLWVDRLDGHGRPIPGPIPASSLYHLFGAFEQTRRVLTPLVVIPAER